MGDITSYEVEVKGMGGDAGVRFDVRCPECGELVHCAEMAYWDARCLCRYSWSVSIEATGSKWDEDE